MCNVQDLCVWKECTSSMGWLRWVASIKLHVSFAKEPYKRDYILQKRPIILSILLTVATPYVFYPQILRTSNCQRIYKFDLPADFKDQQLPNRRMYKFYVQKRLLFHAQKVFWCLPAGCKDHQLPNRRMYKFYVYKRLLFHTQKVFWCWCLYFYTLLQNFCLCLWQEYKFRCRVWECTYDPMQWNTSDFLTPYIHVHCYIASAQVYRVWEYTFNTMQ